MVFGGRFNTACQLCRKRRVKCDEGRPGCRKCAIYGKACPGYSDTFHFAHQTDATKPASRSRVPEAAQAASRAPLSHRRHAASTSASPPQDSTLTSETYYAYPPALLAPGLDPPEEALSLYYFMNRFACRAECAGLPGYLNFLFSLYDPSKSDAFELATLSAARMVAYNRTRQTNKTLRDKSYRDHGLAVAKVRRLLTEEARISQQQKQRHYHDVTNGSNEATEATREALSDRTLGTVLLLSIFGLVNDAASRHAGSHASGIYYLLTRRGPEQGQTSRGREMMILSMVSLQSDAAMRNDFTYCDFASIGILPQGSQILDPMTRVVPILELLCQKSKPLRSLLGNSAFAMSSPGSSSSSQPGQSPGSDRSRGYIPDNAHDAETSTDGSPGSSSTPSSSTAFTDSPSPAITQPDSTIHTIRTAIAALEEFEAWNNHATATWAHFYDGRTSPPMLGQASVHTRLYHPETASTTILMRSYRVRFSMMLLAACQQIIQDLQDSSGTYTTGHHAGWEPAFDEQSSPMAVMTASANASSLSELLSLVTSTGTRLQREIMLAIADMVHCIPFVLDPLPPSSVSSRDATPTYPLSTSPSPAASSSPPWEQSRPALEQLERQPAQQGFQIRDSLRLIIMCPLATPEQKEISRVQLKRVHDIAGIKPDDF